jgi:hypothetical protein
MDLWEVLGLIGILAFWGAIGALPWLAALVASGGRAAPWQTLPLAILIGLGAGALVPALGLHGWGGFWTSLASALLLTSAALLLVTPRLAARALRV